MCVYSFAKLNLECCGTQFSHASITHAGTRVKGPFQEKAGPTLVA